MVVDSSALIAILAAEPDAALFAKAIEQAPVCRISAVNWMEAGIIMDRQKDGVVGREYDLLVDRSKVLIEPVTEEQARLARQAYLVYGKGRHPAGLNLADCFAYALAKMLREPLLFKGEGFRKTDVEIVPLT